MKHIYLNLKRFDIRPHKGGVNRLAPVEDWGRAVVRSTQAGLGAWACRDVEFVQFLPEAHLLEAGRARGENSPVRLGCQGVYREDTAPGGNFGAFTTQRTANAARELGCEYALIGHCEERRDKLGLLGAAGVEEEKAERVVNEILNQELRTALAAGLKVLYCVGEDERQRDRWQDVLTGQLREGLKEGKGGRDAGGSVTVAYEPVWSIGPGRKPAGPDDIRKAAVFIKERTGGLDVVYGGGLKKENARMLAQIGEIDGGLIALTRFSGEIGFYPDEYLEIIKEYLGGVYETGV
ncbi:MAG: triosephosphate isomerase [Lachnospiraceae bacterium]|jgi:triosephosphate isomerase|nr:triosephosphate isomerase [Lachnospiraceae bacterium]